MLQHVALEVRREDVAACLAFWRLLGFAQVEPPETLRERAAWVQNGPTQIHLLYVADPVTPPEGHAAVVAPDYERVLADLRTRTDEVVSALNEVAETFAELAAACCEVADGIFLATTSWARRDTLDEGEYRRFGTAFDLRVLAGARGAALNVLHVCGPGARVVELARYPVAAVSWNPRLPGNPDLAAFLAAVPARGAVGGFSDEAFLSRGTVIAKREAAQSLLQTGGRRWLAAGGCTIPVESRPEAIAAARDALRG